MKDDVILKVENLSKQYRLGLVGTGTISHDFNRFLARIRGKEDPYLKIGESNDRSTKGTSEYVWALKDINFEVKRGEILGIIGKNGAGKSTLLKILSKVTGPTTGAIKSKGRIASLLEVGTGFHPEMTGKENIFLNGAILGMTKKEIASKLDEIIEFSGCERYVETPVKRYSSGMKVRLAFAVAAFLEPDILVVDEVLAVGDAEFQKKAIGKMQDISSQGGRTVLFVSHDMAAIQKLCTRLVVLSNGQIDFVGATDQAVSYYLSNNKTGTANEISKIIKRKGNKSAQFSNISFSYLDGHHWRENITEIPSGMKVYIDVEIENFNKIEREIKVSINIADYLGVPVTNLSNEFTEHILFLNKKKTIIRFEIMSFDLRVGDFKVSLWGEDNLGLFDHIENEINFSIVESDFFGTGRYPKQKVHGCFLIKSAQYNL
ncbi:ABC transporter ATP-binding protein [bacterium]|nr:ABC transporter ATP-binding protein [bacterium]